MGCNSGKATPPSAAPKTPAAGQQTLLTTPAATSSLKDFNDALGDFVEKHPAKDSVEDHLTSRGFDSTWSSGAIISDNGARARAQGVSRSSTLTWLDGIVSSVQIDEAAKIISMNYKGMAFRGELRSDDCIHWSDGDVWTRALDQGLAETPSLQKQGSMIVNHDQDDPCCSHGDKECGALRISEPCGLTAAIDAAKADDKAPAGPSIGTVKDSSVPVPKTASDQLRLAAAPESQAQTDWRTGKLDRISIDTSELDAHKLDKKCEAAGMKLSNVKTNSAPRREKGMCCC